MSRIELNEIMPWTGTDGALTAAAGAADNLTSEWFDVSSWVNKYIAWEVDSAGTIDFNVNIDISSQHAYELNNKTATTEDYVNVEIVDAHTDGVYTRKDGTDVSVLKEPIRSLRVNIENDQAEPVTGCQVWIGGWS